MPTTRPRHTVTESDELARALDRAARAWPEDAGSRARLLVRLALEGERTLEARRERRLQAIRETAGVLTGLYRPDELERLRADWPE